MTQQLKTLLSSSQELRPLLDKAQMLNSLQRDFISVAPAHLAQSCQVLGLYLGTLSIAVANSTLAAKLRQLAPELVVLLQNKSLQNNDLQNYGFQVSGIRVKVQVAFDRSRPRLAPRKLSKTAQHALNELSSSLGDSPLKHALKKMAQK